MEDSRVHISLSQGVFTNLYSALSVAVGTKLAIQNLSAGTVIVYLGATPASSAGFILQPFDYMTVPAGSAGCFAQTTAARVGKLAIELGGFSIPNAPIDERVYNGLKGLTVQSFTEANVKNGTQYEMAYHTASLAAGANLDMLFTTGTEPVLIKNRQVTFTGSSIVTLVYKGTVATGGTDIPIYNLDTWHGGNSLVVAKQSPTVTNTGAAAGAEVHTHGVADQGNRTSGSFAVAGLERALQPSTSYLLRIVNSSDAACKICTYISFYEGELSSLN